MQKTKISTIEKFQQEMLSYCVQSIKKWQYLEAILLGKLYVISLRYWYFIEMRPAQQFKAIIVKISNSKEGNMGIQGAAVKSPHLSFKLRAYEYMVIWLPHPVITFKETCYDLKLTFIL